MSAFLALAVFISGFAGFHTADVSGAGSMNILRCPHNNPRCGK